MQACVIAVKLDRDRLSRVERFPLHLPRENITFRIHGFMF